MTGELIRGFVVVLNGKMVAVESSFEDADAVANKYLSMQPSPPQVEIRLANSEVARGCGASSLRTWIYDQELERWVEK